jgi:protocatechuate 3,4-dioxygenase beta subunit
MPLGGSSSLRCVWRSIGGHFGRSLRALQPGSRLVTQMYFAGEAQNEKDKLFLSASAEGRKSLLARYEAPSGKQERDALVAVSDVALSFG